MSCLSQHLFLFLWGQDWFIVWMTATPLKQRVRDRLPPGHLSTGALHLEVITNPLLGSFALPWEATGTPQLAAPCVHHHLFFPDLSTSERSPQAAKLGLCFPLQHRQASPGGPFDFDHRLPRH